MYCKIKKWLAIHEPTFAYVRSSMSVRAGDRGPYERIQTDKRPWTQETVDRTNGSKRTRDHGPYERFRTGRGPRTVRTDPSVPAKQSHTGGKRKSSGIWSRGTYVEPLEDGTSFLETDGGRKRVDRSGRVSSSRRLIRRERSSKSQHLEEARQAQ